jgi:hypothetical protein
MTAANQAEATTRQPPIEASPIRLGMEPTMICCSATSGHMASSRNSAGSSCRSEAVELSRGLRLGFHWRIAGRRSRAAKDDRHQDDGIEQRSERELRSRDQSALEPKPPAAR